MSIDGKGHKPKHRRQMVCALCKAETHDAFMVTNEVWAAAGLNPTDLAHLPCVARNLSMRNKGRELKLEDFTPAPINNVIRWAWRAGTQHLMQETLDRLERAGEALLDRKG
jgi:hypothetical protein